MTTSDIANAAPSPAPTDASDAPPAPPPGELKARSVDQLIIGRKLKFPIYDAKGVLLLAEGATITIEFLERLRKWDIRSVMLHEEDLDNAALSDEYAAGYEKAGFDEEVFKKLDDLIDSGFVCTLNTKAPLRERRRRPTDPEYDEQKHEALKKRHDESRGFLDELMSNVVQGRSVQVNHVAELAERYMDDMTEDLDNVLATIFASPAEHELADHCLKTALLGMAIGVEMGLDADHVRQIGITGLVHDWGMAQVPPEIRKADRKLTSAEFFEITKHPFYSVKLLEGCRGVPNQVPLISFQVHERPNGNGYPRGRKGEAILLPARVLSVADSYRALVSPRPFRPPLMPYAAMECLIRQANHGDLDPTVVRALLRIHSLFPVSSLVVLSDSSVARVQRANPEDYTRPVVRRIQDAEGNTVEADSPDAFVDLLHSELTVTQALPKPGSDEVNLSPEILQYRSTEDGKTPIRRSSVTSESEMEDDANGHDGFEKHKKPHISLENYSLHQRRALQRALDLADRCAQRTNWRYDESRQHERQLVRVVVHVCPYKPSADTGMVDHTCTFRAIARDISRSGLCFLHPELLGARQLLIALEVTKGQRQWFLGEIVRRREIETEGFWEYGVALQRRIAG